jgi:hypothetical protein
MSTKKLNTMIKRAMLELLREQEEQEQKADQKDQKKSSKGKKPQKKKILMPDRAPVGRGRTGVISDAVGGRAISEPAALLKDLGIRSAQGKSDIEKAFSIIQQAIQNNEIMEEAYLPPKVRKTKNDEVYFEVPVKADELGNRAALKWIHATLYAASRAGALQMEEGIDFLPSRDSASPTVIPEKMKKK